jgi:hypothetical protein
VGFVFSAAAESSWADSDCDLTAEDGSARSVVEVVRGAGAKPTVGEGDHNQDDEVLAVSALGVRVRPVLAIHGAS